MAKTSAAEMPFLDHLEELRWRIIWSLGALIVGLMAGFTIVVKGQLIRVLQEPIAPYLSGKLIFTTPSSTVNRSISSPSWAASSRDSGRIGGGVAGAAVGVVAARVILGRRFG